MIDWSMVASIASSVAGIIASLSAAYLGKLKYHAHRRRQDAIIDARKHGDTELAKSLSDIPPPIPGFLPPLLFALGIGGTAVGHLHNQPPQDEFAKHETGGEMKPRCCPGGCEPGSSCNPRNCHCEARAVKPDAKPKPKPIQTLVRLPLPLDARISDYTYWEPRDCKLNELQVYESL